MARIQRTTFGVVLKHLRLAAGLTQEALADRAGVSSRAVGELERHPDRTPRLETVTQLADALGLDREERTGLLAAARPESAGPATPAAVEQVELPPAHLSTPPLVPGGLPAKVVVAGRTATLSSAAVRPRVEGTDRSMLTLYTMTETAPVDGVGERDDRGHSRPNP